MKTKLKTIAYARSGDKGADANIGVIAREKKWYLTLEKELSEEKVSSFFAGLKPQKVTRYSLKNLNAFNFVLKGVLEGGGNQSLRLDAQGKALGQALLEMEIEWEENNAD